MKPLKVGQEGLCSTAITQADLNDCFAKAANSADAKLKTTYSHYLRLLSSEDKVNLQKAQEAWLRYRDAECKAYAGQANYSGYAMQFDNCINDLTLARIRELRVDYKDMDGQ